MRSVLFHYGAFGLAGPLLVVSSVFGALLSLRSADRETPRSGMDFAGHRCDISRCGSCSFLDTALDISAADLFRGRGLAAIRDVQCNRAEPGSQIHRRPNCGLQASERLSCASTVHPSGGNFCTGGRFCRAQAAGRARLSLSAATFSGRGNLEGKYRARFLFEFQGPVTDRRAAQAGRRRRLASANPMPPCDWAWTSGNDEMSVGLWYYRIPTLFEYNQFMSPAFHALIKRALQRPPIVAPAQYHDPDHPNVHVLKLLGVRYVLTPRPDGSLGELRATEDRAGEPWGLIELSNPNLATYSPTSVETRRDLSSMLDFVVDDSVDLSKQAVAQEQVPGPLTPVRSVALSMAGKDLHVVADSDGRSLIVVPVEFSHCLELIETPAGTGNRCYRPSHRRTCSPVSSSCITSMPCCPSGSARCIIRPAAGRTIAI